MSTLSRINSVQRIVGSCGNILRNLARSRDGRSHSSMGLLGSKELRRKDGFDVLTQRALEESERLVSKICSSPPGEETVRHFDNLSDSLCQVADLAECIRNLHPDPAVVGSAQSSIMKLSERIETLNTHKGLYDKLDAVLSDPTVYTSLDPVTQRVAHSFMYDFLISGVHLEEDSRAKTVELHSKILEAGQAFVAGMNSDMLVPKAYFPSDMSRILPSSPNHKDYYKVNSSVATAVLQRHSNEEMRRLMYCALNAIVPTQLETLESLVKHRHELATLVGYESYAHFATQQKMVGSPEKVLEFLHSLSSVNLVRAKEEIESLRLLKAKDTQNTSEQLKYWDLLYYMDKCDTLHQNAWNSHAVKEYFAFDKCFEGLSRLYSSLYGVTLVEERQDEDNLWDTSVKRIRVEHETEGTLGYILGDFFTHPHRKNYSNCHFTLRGGRQLDSGVYQLPVIVICCDIPHQHPHFMSLSNVESFFHEMGHALHSMLGRTRYQQVTGTRCSLDFAEIPSTLNEVFLKDPRVIRSFAKHYSTEETIPEDAVSTLLQCINSFPAIELQTQIMYASFDVLLHLPPVDGKSSVDLWKEVVDSFSPLSHVPNTAWFLQFGHLHVYGSKYFSYLWARAIANLIWKDCFHKDPFSRVSGEQYRNKMLCHGGEFPASKLVFDLLGYEPTIQDLVNALTDS